MNTFSIGDAVRFGWETFKKRPWFIIGAVAAMGIFSMSVGYKTESWEEAKEIMPLTIPLSVALMAVSVAANILFTRFLLKAHDAVETMTYWDTLPARPFLKYIGGKIITSIVIVISFILLIIPGVILSIGLAFTPYLIVDKGMWPIEAMKESWRITKGHKWQLFVFGLAIAGLNILGFLALFVGLLVSVPVTMLATAHVYRTLEHKANEIAPAA